MIILYYSRRTAFPALLASLKHCHPTLSLEQAWPQAVAWLQQYCHAGEPPFFLKRFGESPEGDTLYLMTAGVPPPVIKRTLNGLAGLLKSRHDPAWFLLADVLPPCRGRWGPISSPIRKAAFWMEIEAFVAQTRLQVELIKQQ